MGTNSKPKKRGLAYYLHRQWTGTRIGREEHERRVKVEKESPIKVRKVKAD